MNESLMGSSLSESPHSPSVNHLSSLHTPISLDSLQQQQHQEQKMDGLENDHSPSDIEHSQNGDGVPMQVPPILTEVDDRNIALWRWQMDGRKRVNSIGNSCITRKYFRCSNSKSTSCPAKYHVVCTDGEPSEAPVRYNGAHNHPPPENLPKSREMLLHGDKGLERKEFHFSLNRQNHNSISWRSSIPSGDAISRLIQKFGQEDGFCKCVQLHPVVRIVFMDSFANNILEERGEHLFLDATWSLVEGQLFLVTLMVKIDDIGFPVAWMLTNTKKQENYEWFLSFINSLLNAYLSPTFVFCDYESRLHQACSRIYPQSLVLGDSFHFLHANKNWLAKYGGVEHVKAMTASLCRLWASPIEIFQHNLDQFIMAWETAFPPYAQYFKQYWVEEWKPQSWALCMREASKAPTGDLVLEPWNKHMKTAFLSLPSEDLEVIALRIFDIWTHWKKTLESTELMADAHKLIQKKREKYTRFSSIIVGPPSPPQHTLHPLAAIGNSILAPHSPNSPSSHAYLTHPHIVFSTPSPPQQHTHTHPHSPHATLTQSTSSLPELCPQCHHAKLNKQCSFSKCVDCCGKSNNPCRVKSHKQAKAKNNITSPYSVHITQAMDNKAKVYLKYAGGSSAGNYVAIIPLQWGTEGFTFQGICVNTGTQKTYRTAAIEDLRTIPPNSDLTCTQISTDMNALLTAEMTHYSPDLVHSAFHHTHHNHPVPHQMMVQNGESMSLQSIAL